jgi:hypothetical protein
MCGRKLSVLSVNLLITVMGWTIVSDLDRVAFIVFRGIVRKHIPGIFNKCLRCLIWHPNLLPRMNVFSVHVLFNVPVHPLLKAFYGSWLNSVGVQRVC